VREIGHQQPEQQLYQQQHSNCNDKLFKRKETFDWWQLAVTVEQQQY